jgi:salicylate hydroxylase
LELVETGEPIGHLEWREDVLKETGADFLLMHHGDLLRLFYKLCLSVGVTVNFNAAAIAIRVNEDAEKIEVKTMNGRVYSADVLVGADGFGSIVREKVLGKRDYGINSGMSVYT